LLDAGSSAGINPILQREGEKTKKEREVITTWGTHILVTHPSINPAQLGLTLLSGRDVVLSFFIRFQRIVSHGILDNYAVFIVVLLFTGFSTWMGDQKRMSRVVITTFSFLFLFPLLFSRQH